VVRGEPGKEEGIEVPLGDLLKGHPTPRDMPTLQAGDKIVVPRSGQAQWRDALSLIGGFINPIYYAWGMTHWFR
jgi:hypothetical protein